MCPVAWLVAVDGCVTFVPLHKSHPPPSLPRISLCRATMWLGVCDFNREVGTCGLERGCLVQGQPLCPKTRVKFDWRRMDTSQSRADEGRRTEATCASAAIQQPRADSHHHISLRLISLWQSAIHTGRVQAVLFLFLFLLLQLIFRVFHLPRGILILCPCKPIRHCFYTRIYWLILFWLLASGRALLFVKLLNYQWGLGSSNEADPTTRSTRSITRECQMSIFYIFRTESIANHCVRLLCHVKVCRKKK